MLATQDNNTTPVFSADTLAVVQSLIKRYPEGKQKSALLPVLHLAQAEFGGWLSAPTMDYVASLLNITNIEVYEVASFYSMYNLNPVGKCLIELCHTAPCWLRGAEDIALHLENKLNIKFGETTTDGMFTLKRVECLGSCGTAPMFQCGAAFYEDLTNEKVDTILTDLRTKNEQSSYVDSDTFRRN